jgi:Xaa-Pro aminopeptidase
MQADLERISRIVNTLEQSGLDGVVCFLPTNVLLLSGYWPVVGTAIAIASRQGEISLVVPADELSLAERGWAKEIHIFESGSLQTMHRAIDGARRPLVEALRGLGLTRGRLGIESGPGFEPASYAAMHFYGISLRDLLWDVTATATTIPADSLLAQLRSCPTDGELARIRIAARIAARAYRVGADLVESGQREYRVAAGFRGPLYDLDDDQVARADGYAFCMSGPNSADAHGSYARSRSRRIEAGDFLLVHCNSYADGYWTDITRTYCLGEPSQQQVRMYQAVMAARDAAFAAIAPGVRASDVDRAARDEIDRRGFGGAFRHATGHGVGFAAIDHNAIPRIHPQSSDRLERGMVFNVEPAIYLERVGGLRHCDMVAVTEDGMELLTPFHSGPAELKLNRSLIHTSSGAPHA